MVADALLQRATGKKGAGRPACGPRIPSSPQALRLVS
jgi:hypothetical protein